MLALECRLLFSVIQNQAGRRGMGIEFAVWAHNAPLSRGNLPAHLDDLANGTYSLAQSGHNGACHFDA
jgi:hypothetical protein